MSHGIAHWRKSVQHFRGLAKPVVYVCMWPQSESRTDWRLVRAANAAAQIIEKTNLNGNISFGSFKQSVRLIWVCGI